MKIDITPTPEVIEGFCNNNNVTLSVALCELIDNSLDSGATRIEIGIAANCIDIWDNGGGCGDLQEMLVLGRKRDRKATGVGRYGVGLKQAAMNLGSILDITSVHGGFLRTISIDWGELRKAGKWEVDAAEEIPCAEETQTLVKISGLRPNYFRERRKLRKKADDIRADLSLRYGAAIRAGVQIIFELEDVQSAALPDLQTPYQKSGELTTGDCRMRYETAFGVLGIDSGAWKAGVSVSVHGRMIEHGNIECMGDELTHNFWMHVILLDVPRGQMGIDMLKQNIGAEHMEWLFNELCEKHPDILLCLKHAKELQKTLSMKWISDEVSYVLTQVAAPLIREIRERRGERGSHERKGGPQRIIKSNKADPDKPGSVEHDEGSSQNHFPSPEVKIDFAELHGPEQEWAMKFSKPKRQLLITFNTRKEFVRQWQQTKDVRMFAMAASNILMMITSKKQPDLFYSLKAFIDDCCEQAGIFYDKLISDERSIIRCRF